VDKKGEEWYQIQVGGSSENNASLGKVLGPSVPKDQVAEVIGRLLAVYLDLREDGERFLDTYRRVGVEPFRERAYAELEVAA
jgi:sulfite reductase (NADPH) hemoprotein beta-component